MKSILENNTLTLSLEGRIDSTNAPAIEKAIMAEVSGAPGAEIVLDAGKLEYISSAGLRVLMKLRKQAKKALPVVNVSPEVYDIFEVTGFTELLDVKKRLREISVEGLPLIGRGATAKVYRLDPETVVKVFNPGMRMESIQSENESGRNAFLLGIPTAISYDLVKVGDCYGSVCELLDARDFVAVLEGDRANLSEHISRYARKLRELHQIEVDPAKFPPSRQKLLKALPMLLGVCSQEELDKLRRLFELVPDRNTFIHGDCHPGNVMVQNGEFVFIDMMTSGSGHPIIDMSSMCATYHMSRSSEGGVADSPIIRPFSEEERACIWDSFLRASLDTEDEDLIQRAERQITAFSAARVLFAAVAIPGFYTQARIDYLKRLALSYVDEGMEPLCF